MSTAPRAADGRGLDLDPAKGPFAASAGAHERGWDPGGCVAGCTMPTSLSAHRLLRIATRAVVASRSPRSRHRRTATSKGGRRHPDHLGAFGCPSTAMSARPGFLNRPRAPALGRTCHRRHIGVADPWCPEGIEAVRKSAPGPSSAFTSTTTRNTARQRLASVEAGGRVLDASVVCLGGCPFAPTALATSAPIPRLHAGRAGFRDGYDPSSTDRNGPWMRGIGKNPASLACAGASPILPFSPSRGEVAAEG